MKNFEQIRSHLTTSGYRVSVQEPYVACVELSLDSGSRHQAIFLSELSNDDARLPWHRVLRSDGRIAFPEGSKGYREQSQRLRAEGVRVEQGRVRGVKAARTLDEALWGPPGG